MCKIVINDRNNEIDLYFLSTITIKILKPIVTGYQLVVVDR